MLLTCPHCSRSIEYSGEAPRFCGYCGQALSASGPEAPTLAYQPQPSTVTLGPEATAEAAAAEPVAVGDYRQIRRLGGGGMGAVYEAEDPTGRRVALKLIAPQFITSRDAVERFRQEGRLASAIAHPRCVFVVAADEAAGRPYIVMELMPGDTLDDLVRRDGPLPPQQAVAKMLDAIDGLQEAHRLGVIHRDVKPSNCFLDRDGRVKIGDFGLSKSLISDQQLTKTGSFLGTPLYSSPEQIRGEPVNEQTDVYSVAATLYFLLTGKAPFQSGDALATLARIAADDPPPMRIVRPEIPEALDRIVLRGLERERSRRWQNLGEFAEALRAFLPGQLSISGLGMRLGAYVCDYFLTGTVFMLGMYALDLGLGSEAFVYPYVQVEAYPAGVALSLLLWIIYFGIPEGLWGQSLGKLLLGLRVRRTHIDEPPGIPRAVGRALLTGVAPELLTMLAIFWLSQVATRAMRWEELMKIDPLLYVTVSASQPLGVLLGAFLLCSPMRARNNYRGTHDLLFDTLVVSVPRQVRRIALEVTPVEQRVRTPTVDTPAQIGPFAVHGVVHERPDETVLLAREPALGRWVFLWLRARSEEPLLAARRELARLTRLRWLACGQHAEWQWDAFLAVASVPVVDRARAQTPADWFEIRHLFVQLVDELVASSRDGTLPAEPDLGLIRVLQDGRLLLFDFHLDSPDQGRGRWGTSTRVLSAGPELEEKALALAAQTARALMNLDPDTRPVRPLPQHGQRIVQRLVGGDSPYVGLSELAADFAHTGHLPAEVTRVRRGALLALQAAILAVPLWMILFVALAGSVLPLFRLFIMQQERDVAQQSLSQGLRHDAAAVLNPDVLVQLRAVERVHNDFQLLQALEDRRQQDERMEKLSREVGAVTASMTWDFIESWRHDPRFEITPEPAFRADAARVAAEREFGNTPKILYWYLGVPLGFWPVLWIVWAFAFRGGLSYRITGMALVRRDGRPAARWQTAWRGALLWLPFAGFLFLSVTLTWEFWSTGPGPNPPMWMAHLATFLWWLAVALLPAYVLLALWQPARSLNDRLAGTWLVPR
jgi:hypothetical protein